MQLPVATPVQVQQINYYSVLITGIFMPVLLIVPSVYLRTRYRFIVTTGSDLLIGALCLDLASFAGASAFHLTPLAQANFTPFLWILTPVTALVLYWSSVVEKNVETKAFWERVRRERVARAAGDRATERADSARFKVLVASSMVLAMHVVLYYLAVQG